ncbi:MAG: rhodanese-like domain-containing protein [Flavobacteriales bacterium]|nr:rhodanese-like domain-containing protein [Flavobacteriales bacterium]MCC6938088.1 rhodanese-like domain-containing protein [Flavobacteriales bacterium]
MRTTLNLFLSAAFLVFAGCSAAQNTKQPTELDVKAFSQAMTAKDVQLVDVRTPQEYAAGHLVGSVNVNWTADDYETTFAKLDKTKPVLLYCQAGGRSEQALEYLLEHGYKAQHLSGGYGAWKKEGMPSTK